MSRIGRKNTPFYRIGVYDAHRPQDGVCLEKLGWYNPRSKKTEDELRINLARAEYWLSVGAQPTPKMAILLKRAGVGRPKK